MKNLQDTPLTERYARKCDVTGKGMNEGFCFGGGEFYCKSEEDAIKELRRIIEADWHKDIKDENLSDEDLKEWGYDSEIYYYTEWYDPSDIEDDFYTLEGEHVEVE